MQRQRRAEPEHEGEQRREDRPDHRVHGDVAERRAGQDLRVIVEPDKDLVLHRKVRRRFEEAEFDRVVDRIGDDDQHHDQRRQDVEIVCALGVHALQQAAALGAWIAALPAMPAGLEIVVTSAALVWRRDRQHRRRSEYCLCAGYMPREQVLDLLGRVVRRLIDRHLARQRVLHHVRHDDVHDLGRLRDHRERNAVRQHGGRHVEELDGVQAFLHPLGLEAAADCRGSSRSRPAWSTIPGRSRSRRGPWPPGRRSRHRHIRA